MQIFLISLLVIVSFGLVASCSVSHANKTDYSLCKALATLPSYNIHKEAREKEVRSRGLNCRKFADQINKEVAEEKLTEARATKVYNNNYNSYPSYPSNPYSSNSNRQVKDYSDLVCKYGKVMTNYGCRYR